MGRDQRQSSARRLVLLALLALLAGIGFVVWVGPQLAGWVNTGRWTPLGFWQAQARRSAPWQARARTATYPPALRRSLPPGWEFWTVQAVVAITAVSVAVVAVREIDVRASRPVAGRRWWQLRGTRPRAFARPRTIPNLLAEKAEPDRIVIGSYGRPSRLLAIAPTVQGLVVAAPRSGNTSGSSSRRCSSTKAPSSTRPSAATSSPPPGRAGLSLGGSDRTLLPPSS
jgi:hypothetical protein